MVAELHPAIPVVEDSGEKFIGQQEADKLADVYLTRLEPLVKRIIARKLRVSLLEADDRQQNQDALELVSEIKLLILRRLYKTHSDEDGAVLNNLEAYVRIVTTNAFNQYLRQKYPRRLSLTNQLRYLLTHSSKFSLWKDENEGWMCGPANCATKKPSEPVVVTDDLRAKLIQKIDLSHGHRSSKQVRP